jgi:hypothetical protein
MVGQGRNAGLHGEGSLEGVLRIIAANFNEGSYPQHLPQQSQKRLGLQYIFYFSKVCVVLVGKFNDEGSKMRRCQLRR